MLTSSSLIDLAIAHVWQVSLLVALVGMVNHLIGRTLPRLASLLWSVVAIKSVTPPIFASWLGVFSWVQAGAASMPSEGGSMMIVSLTPGVGMIHTVLTVLAVVWASGVVVLTAWFVAKLVVLERLLRRDAIAAHHPLHRLCYEIAAATGQTVPKRVVISTDEIGPAVSGLWRPTLILPQSLADAADRATLEPVILHELVHTNRRDAGHAMLMSVVRIAWWFHPGVWWATHKADELVERCVDLTVTRELKTELIDYARGLTRVLELRGNLSTPPALSGLRPCQITVERLKYLREANRSDNTTRGSGAKRGLRFSLALAFAVIVLPGLPLNMLAPKCEKPDFHNQSEATVAMHLNATK